jgi:predicted metal-binding transcription factor (methanogenesis marker protein 9)
MIHNINVTIEVNLINISEEEYRKIHEKLTKNIFDANPERLSLEDLDEILYMKKRKYLTKSIRFPELDNSDDNEFTIKTTYVEIQG